MRPICTITPKEKEESAYEFSYYLKRVGIDNQCEEIISPGAPIEYRIWVVEEEKIKEAEALYEEYHNNPRDPKYRHVLIMETPPPAVKTNKNGSRNGKSSYGPFTVVILMSVIALFLWGWFEKGIRMPSIISGITSVPEFPPIDQKLLFDYPKYFELRDSLLKNYKEGTALTQEQEAIFQKMRSTPYWNGFYERLVAKIKENKEIAYHGPIFEKIGQGEVWRLFTPALIHFGFLHIFFNLLWFIMLASQIEFRIGFLRYLTLIVLTAVISNVVQYLMSGFSFMGLSGVVVGLAGFIFARQQVAPWEGYLLQRMTFLFLFIFVMGMFALQLLFFFLELFTSFHIQIAIANAAHLAGGITGYLLGRLRLFSLRTRNF